MTINDHEIAIFTLKFPPHETPLRCRKGPSIAGIHENLQQPAFGTEILPHHLGEAGKHPYHLEILRGDGREAHTGNQQGPERSSFKPQAFYLRAGERGHFRQLLRPEGHLVRD